MLAFGQQMIRDIGADGRIAAGVLGGKLAVHPNTRTIIDSAEVKDQALPVFERRGIEGTAIPDDRIEAGIAEPAGLGFWTERDNDLVIPFHFGR
jgi:hypothetical protein